jgi:hypothetical protein
MKVIFFWIPEWMANKKINEIQRKIRRIKKKETGDSGILEHSLFGSSNIHSNDNTS